MAKEKRMEQVRPQKVSSFALTFGGNHPLHAFFLMNNSKSL